MKQKKILSLIFFSCHFSFQSNIKEENNFSPLIFLSYFLFLLFSLVIKQNFILASSSQHNWCNQLASRPNCTRNMQCAIIHMKRTTTGRRITWATSPIPIWVLTPNCSVKTWSFWLEPIIAGLSSYQTHLNQIHGFFFRSICIFFKLMILIVYYININNISLLRFKVFVQKRFFNLSVCNYDFNKVSIIKIL